MANLRHHPVTSTSNTEKSRGAPNQAQETSEIQHVDSIPEPEDACTLIVVLTTLSNAEAAKFSAAISATKAPKGKIKIWTPSKATSRALSCIRDAHDSQSVVYAVAITAARLGWKTCFIADCLTRRQISIDHRIRLGESQIMSLTAVGLFTQPAHLGGKDTCVDIVARRIEIDDLVSNPNLRLMYQSSIGTKYSSGAPFHRQHLSCHGLALHDPDKALFTKNMLHSTGRENKLSAISEAGVSWHLPPELGDSILVEVDLSECFQNFHVHEEKQDSIPIYSLCPMSSELRLASENSIRAAFKKEGVDDHGVDRISLISWPLSRAATRRDVLNLVENLVERYGSAFSDFLFTYDVFNSPQDLIGYCRVHQSPLGNIALFQRSTISCFYQEIQPNIEPDAGRPPIYDSILDNFLNKRHTFLPGVEWREGENSEFLYHTDSPLYATPPPWIPCDLLVHAWPVFYLTKHVSCQGQQAVEKALQDRHDRDAEYFNVDGEKAYCYVPWKRDVDATLHDMWNICVEIYTCSGECTTQFIGIDRQSFEDKSVMVCNIEIDLEDERLSTMPMAKTSGMLYVRVEAKSALFVCAELDLQTMELNELVEDAKFFPRPDHPSRSEASLPRG
ncbi:MAG: hypothetical protein Q9227_004316 [Pyrenula ochraceoflavens]